MDSDFWIGRLAAAKRQFKLQHHHHLSHSHGSSQSDRFGRDGFEVEEDIRSDFPCPYCYEEFDMASLCPHLEDEHSCESRPTVCPVCSVKVTRDLLGHITLQHGHLLKFQRRRRLRRVPIPNSQAMSLLGKDLREAHLQVLLGGSTYRSNSAASSNVAVADPLLSSLVSSFSCAENDELSKSVMSSIEEITKTDISQHVWKSSSLDLSLSREEREEITKQAARRAVFLQDVLVSALYSD